VIRWLHALPILPALLTASCATVDPDARVSAQDTLSVVSFNLYHDKADWPQRLPLIVAGLRALQPDVIALQEVLQHEQLPNQAQTIADALGYEMYFVSTDPPGQPRRYGNAILTPHPILARSERRLQPYDDARTVAHVRIAIDGRAVDVYTTHLHYTIEGDAIRRRQLQDVLAHIDDTGDGAPHILLGDFNAPVTSAAFQPLLADYIDSYGSRHAEPDAPANATMNPEFFDRAARIDHIFAERGRFEVLDADIVLDQPDADGHWPSDHFGMHAVLRLVPSATGERP
jgi:beta-glucosidase